MNARPPSPCARCSAPLLSVAAPCPTCGAPAEAHPAGLTERYREAERLMKSPPIRAAYLLPLAVPGLAVGAVIVTKLVPKPYEDMVGDVVAAVIAIGVFAGFGAILYVSARSAAKGGRFHVLQYALLAAAIVLAVAAQLVSHGAAEVLQVLAVACTMLSIPATLLSTALRGQAAIGGAPAPAKLDGATIKQAVKALGASFSTAARTSWSTEVPPVPFDESPAARIARLEQLRALNAMLRAARANAAPIMGLGKLMIAGFPVVMLAVAALGVLIVVQGALGRLPPKTSIGDGAVMTALGVAAAVAFYSLVIAPHETLGKRVALVAQHVGSSVVAGSATAMLDWLDTHWPELVRHSGVSTMGWHWSVQFTFRGHPALVSVLDDLGGRGVPRARRIEVFLAWPCSAPLVDAEGVARCLARRPRAHPHRARGHPQLVRRHQERADDGCAPRPATSRGQGRPPPRPPGCPQLVRSASVHRRHLVPRATTAATLPVPPSARYPPPL